MRHPIRLLARRTAVAAVLVTIALALVPTAFGDGWARDHADAVAVQGLDPGIRTAIRTANDYWSKAPRGRRDDPASLAVRRRLRLVAAALGLVTGIAAMGAVLVCVSLVRHDGRLRHA